MQSYNIDCSDCKWIDLDENDRDIYICRKLNKEISDEGIESCEYFKIPKKCFTCKHSIAIYYDIQCGHDYHCKLQEGKTKHGRFIFSTNSSMPTDEYFRCKECEIGKWEFDDGARCYI